MEALYNRGFESQEGHGVCLLRVLCFVV